MSASLWADSVSRRPIVEKLLTEPGVYGTFAAYSFDEEWAKEDEATRIAHLTVLKGVVEQHREKIAIDLYLMRGAIRSCRYPVSDARNRASRHAEISRRFTEQRVR